MSGATEPRLAAFLQPSGLLDPAAVDRLVQRAADEEQPTLPAKLPRILTVDDHQDMAIAAMALLRLRRRSNGL